MKDKNFIIRCDHKMMKESVWRLPQMVCMYESFELHCFFYCNIKIFIQKMVREIKFYFYVCCVRDFMQKITRLPMFSHLTYVVNINTLHINVRKVKPRKIIKIKYYNETNITLFICKTPSIISLFPHWIICETNTRMFHKQTQFQIFYTFPRIAFSNTHTE